MAASRSDQGILAGNSAFQDRVRQSMVAASISIYNEGWAVVFHRQRARQCINIVNNPDLYKISYAISVATDATVIADATQAGTVVLSSANIVAQQALVTDAHIDNAISGQFNAFFETVS